MANVTLAFEATGKGLSHARLLAVQSMVQENIDSLNTTLASDTTTAPIVSASYGGSVSADHASIGMLRELWKPTDVSGKGGPLRICVCMSDNQRGTDFEAQQKYFGDTTRGLEYRTHTSIMVYFHSDVFRDENPVTRALREEIAMARTSDWLRSVCNDLAYRTLTLDSHELEPEPGFDKLKDCFVRVGFLGRFGVSFGGQETLIGLHFLHTGVIAG